MCARRCVSSRASDCSQRPRRRRSGSTRSSSRCCCLEAQSPPLPERTRRHSPRRCLRILAPDSRSSRPPGRGEGLCRRREGLASERGGAKRCHVARALNSGPVRHGAWWPLGPSDTARGGPTDGRLDNGVARARPSIPVPRLPVRDAPNRCRRPRRTRPGTDHGTDHARRGGTPSLFQPSGSRAP